MWAAWLNLEARHGEPPQEAVMALFRRALPFTDAKRLYLALLSILEASQMVWAQQALHVAELSSALQPCAEGLPVLCRQSCRQTSSR